MLIDTHAHLNDDRLIPQCEEIISNMAADGIAAIINVGYDYKSSVYSVELADKYKHIYAAVGIHPHDAKTATGEYYDYFKKAAENIKVVAIGEIGLDYHYDYSPRDVQARVFVEQLELADHLKLPVIIHLREAYEDMFKLLNDNKSKLTNSFVLHCYSGSAEMAESFNSFDCYYSFGGAITFAKNKDKVIERIPTDRILLETDCPYMTPIPFRGKMNVPKNIFYSAKVLAGFLNITIEELSEITNTNAKRLFRRLI